MVIDVINFTPLGNSITDREVGLPNKEAISGSSAPSTYSIQEGERQVSSETAEYIDSRAEIMDIGEDLQKIGLSPTQTTNFTTFKEVELPTDEKIEKGLKAPVSSSFRWWAELVRLFFLRKTQTA